MVKGIGYFCGGFLYFFIKMMDELGSYVYKLQVGVVCQGFMEGVKIFKLNKKVIFCKIVGEFIDGDSLKIDRFLILVCLIYV